jgi:hypothetical protein
MMNDWDYYKGFFVMFGGIALVGWIIALLDWLARRKDVQSERHPPLG